MRTGSAVSPGAGDLSLCIGMATYDDFDGVWFTIESICMYHPEVAANLSFVVIDNHPDGAAAASLRALAGYVPNYSYVPFAGFTGTSVRDLLFRESAAEIICCVDSHVLLAPGALAALARWFATHPDSADLVQGPILWDDLKTGTTHMDPVWREGMFGTWGTVPVLPEPDADPFEIELHGLGAFACRRDAWPSINPGFRGFGGEEGYVHEKFRRQGGRVLCHPAFRWAHRFGRPAGPAYPNRWEDRIRNYIVGWSELGWNLAPIEGHFRALLGPGFGAVWQLARAQAEQPLSAFEDLARMVVGEDRPALAAGSEAFRRGDGLTVRRAASGRVYELNETGALVLGLCDGTRTLAEIAGWLARAYELAKPPLEQVSSCVRLLREAGILAGASGPGVGRASAGA